MEGSEGILMTASIYDIPVKKISGEDASLADFKGDVVLIVNVALLARVKVFAWSVFFRVLGWALLAYLVIAGILEFVFIYDLTPSHQLALFSVLLFLFATDVPLILAFSVARWQVPEVLTPSP